jgi:hypothetical protein
MLRASVLAGGLAVLGCTGCASSLPAASASPPRLVLAQATPESSTAAGGATPSGQEGQPLSDHGERQMRRFVGWISLAVGADAALLAIVTSGMMLHESSIRSSDCNSQKVCSADGIAANGKLGSLAAWNGAAWAVAVVGVGVGAFLLITNPSDKSLKAEVGVGQTGTGDGLLLRGSF